MGERVEVVIRSPLAPTPPGVSDIFDFIAALPAGSKSKAEIDRARLGLRTPDAIHLASALERKAERVLTGDTDFVRCDEIPFEVVRES